MILGPSSWDPSCVDAVQVRDLLHAGLAEKKAGGAVVRWFIIIIYSLE